jgi:hypothetical protein
MAGACAAAADCGLIATLRAGPLHHLSRPALGPSRHFAAIRNLVDAALEEAGAEIKRNKSDRTIGLNSGRNAGTGHALPHPVQAKELGEDREEVSFGCGVYICVFRRRDRANLEPGYSAERPSIRKRKRGQRHRAPDKCGRERIYRASKHPPEGSPFRKGRCRQRHRAPDKCGRERAYLGPNHPPEGPSIRKRNVSATPWS